MFKPTLEEAKEYAKEYKVIPVMTEILSDFQTPIETLKVLKNISKHTYILESMESHKMWGRYTFLGYNPVMEVTCTNGIMHVKNIVDNNVSEEKVETDHPDKFLKEILEKYTSPKVKGMPSFTGGFVGYFSYDYIKYSEPQLNLDANDDEGFKDIDLMLFDKVIAYDNWNQKLFLITNVFAENIEENYERAKTELKEMIDIISSGKKIDEKKGCLKSEIRPLFEKQEFMDMVKKAKNYIYEGDIFQVVLSNRLEAEYEGSLLNAYRVLRTTNPSPYMFYLSSDDIEVTGASPETLVKLQDGTLFTFPLAGTKPRGKDEEEDKRLEEELLSDEKELSEHNMLVDLGRNDIGRISKFGTVKVEKYMNIEKFSHVMHIGSTVTGTIKDEFTAVDAVNAVLPAGTLSGAPKIRACEIINELENNKRGIYGGAIGYLDFAGNLDTCIAIRMAFKKNGKVFIRSGAGIVADSDPEKEFEECINKAKAVTVALEAAQEV